MMGNTNGKSWPDQLALRVKHTLNRLYDDFVAFKGSNIKVPPSTALPSIEAGMPRKHKWGMRFVDTHELKKSLNNQLDLERYLLA